MTGACRSPQRILAISFKRDAARNLKERVNLRCSPEQGRRFDSYTYDAFAKSLVDRFLALSPAWCRPPRDYRIMFPSERNDWPAFLRGLRPPVALGGEAAAQALRMKEVDGWGPLPLLRPQPRNITTWAALEWWRSNLAGARPALSFPMISRLARAILAENPDVLRALRLTYSHVFLDEFQDTTGSQYALVEQAFGESDSIMTAVGDTKQRIMTWAGAETDVFTWFERRFGARREKLQLNHRSNRRIVQIINDLVTEIEPDAVETICANADREPPEDAAEFWIFANDQAEANQLADFISNDIAINAEEGRSANDFALLVRMRADQTEEQLRPSFEARGLRLRNEARALNRIPIQDLMADEAVNLMIGLLRLAAGVRGHEVYRPVQEIIGQMNGIDDQNPSDVKRLDIIIRRILTSIKAAMSDRPADADMDRIVRAIVDEVGEAAIKRTFRQYDNDAYFSDLQSALAALLDEYVADEASWFETIDGAQGRGQIRLMTIHKSKGLEYHTVIFVGLHQNAFFGYRNNREEETNNFFVALSRARERVYFTRSRTSGGVDQISGLIEILERADVPFFQFE